MSPLGPVSTRMFRLYLDNRLLYGAHLDLTWRCPLMCRHCYLGGTRCPELPFERIIHLLDELKALGVMSLGLSGGEVFSRSDFLDILEAALERHFWVSVKTSGMVEKEDLLERFAAACPSQVDISIYSYIPQVHDDVVRRPGAFERTLKTILFLQERGVTVMAVLTLLRGFCEDAELTTRKLNELGVNLVGYNTFSTLRCEGWADKTLGVDERALMFQIKKTARAFSLRPTGSDDIVCGAGVTYIYIAPDGTVQPCLSLRIPAGNIAQTPLADVWNNSPVLDFYRRLRWRDLGSCASCEDRNWCGFCFAKSLEETGDPLKPIPQFCRMARLRRDLAAGTGADFDE